jgi:hypothetical protein
MNAETRAVHECREILGNFLRGALDYGEFRAKMASAMGPLDPLDWAMKNLDATTGREAEMVVELLGGPFGETDDRIPRRPEWKYGECDEPYGWVDQDEVRRRLREAFGAVLGKAEG